MFPLVSGPSDVLQQSVFILNPIIFRETFCRITRIRNIAHPRNFGSLFIYYSSTIFQFLDSIYLMVNDFIFHLRDTLAYFRDMKTTNKHLEANVLEKTTFRKKCLKHHM